MELDSFDLLLSEKFRVIQVLSKGVSEDLAKPEFVLWACQIMNNEPADFEHVNLPTSLELAWAIHQFRVIAHMQGEKLEVPEEFKDVVWYILNEEGWTHTASYFDPFVSKSLTPTENANETKETEEEDKLRKLTALNAYFKHMSEISNV